jgi:Spy/CpxP family protein refolding chaperone
MVTSQKPTAPNASSKAKPNHPVASTVLAVTAAQPTPSSGGPDSTGFVHRLEDALRLVESLQLTNEQKAKISQLTAAQTARSAEEKKLHRITHEQILALLTSDQEQTLRAASDAPGHSHADGLATPVEHPVHA